MLCHFSVTCRRQGKLRQRSFTQTCENRENGPITVTSSNHFVRAGQPGSSEWNETQYVRQLRRLGVERALSASLREARAYFREGHLPNPALWEYANEELEQDLFMDLVDH